MELQIKRDPVSGTYYYEEVREVETDIDEVEEETPQEVAPAKRGRPQTR